MPTSTLSLLTQFWCLLFALHPFLLTMTYIIQQVLTQYTWKLDHTILGILVHYVMKRKFLFTPYITFAAAWWIEWSCLGSLKMKKIWKITSRMGIFFFITIYWQIILVGKELLPPPSYRSEQNI